MIPEVQHLNGIANHLDKSHTIIQNMAKRFEENKINSVNHWATIHKCALDLNYLLHLKYHNRVCSVVINDIEILKSPGDTEYCAKIQACRDLIKLFAKVSFIFLFVNLK